MQREQIEFRVSNEVSPYRDLVGRIVLQMTRIVPISFGNECRSMRFCVFRAKHWRAAKSARPSVLSKIREVTFKDEWGPSSALRVVQEVRAATGTYFTLRAKNST